MKIKENEEEKISDSTINSLKKDISLLNKLELSTSNKEKKDISDFSINDLNNYIDSNRKLILNNKEEFWVHDKVLAYNSQYFNKLLLTKEIFPSEETKETIEGKTYIRTYIEVPHSQYFFDILAYFYSKDITRIALIADEPESYISILALGIFLGLKQEFFDNLLKSCELKMDEKLINTPFWSRFSFPFLVLIKLVELIPKENIWLRIIALLCWLKEDTSRENNNNIINTDINDSINEDELKEYREFELMSSDDLLNVRDYIQKKHLCNSLSMTQIQRLNTLFPNLTIVLDTKYIIEKYIINNNTKISCKICKLKSNNINDFINKKCVEKYYHPKKMAQFQRQISHKCYHLGCKQKLAINEFPCCHSQNIEDGCLLSDGNHLLNIHN